MSTPREPEPVKLMASIFSPSWDMLYAALEDLARAFGRIDWISPRLLFDRTRYYAREMGWPLYRHFVAFSPLISAGDLVRIKLEALRIEEEYLQGAARQVNIDPGILSAERLILATGKNYIHRVYLGQGIYADLTLIFQRKSFRPLPWTYKDYGEPRVIGWLNGLRRQYLFQLRRHRAQGSLGIQPSWENRLGEEMTT